MSIPSLMLLVFKSVVYTFGWWYSFERKNAELLRIAVRMLLIAF